MTQLSSAFISDIFLGACKLQVEITVGADQPALVLGLVPLQADNNILVHKLLEHGAGVDWYEGHFGGWDVYVLWIVVMSTTRFWTKAHAVEIPSKWDLPHFSRGSLMSGEPACTDYLVGDSLGKLSHELVSFRFDLTGEDKQHGNKFWADCVKAYYIGDVLFLRYLNLQPWTALSHCSRATL